MSYEKLNGRNGGAMEELPFQHPTRMLATFKAVLADPEAYLLEIPAVEAALYGLHLMRLVGYEEAQKEMDRPWLSFKAGRRAAGKHGWPEEDNEIVLGLPAHEAAAKLGLSVKSIRYRRRRLKAIAAEAA